MSVKVFVETTKSRNGGVDVFRSRLLPYLRKSKEVELTMDNLSQLHHEKLEVYQVSIKFLAVV